MYVIVWNNIAWIKADKLRADLLTFDEHKRATFNTRKDAEACYNRITNKESLLIVEV